MSQKLYGVLTEAETRFPFRGKPLEYWATFAYSCDMPTPTQKTVTELAQELMQAQKENAELKLDAERYRRLKNYFFEIEDDDMTLAFRSHDICRNEGESLDTALDRHIKDDDNNG